MIQVSIDISGNMPRVAMYIWHFHPFVGGAEQQCKRLSEELVKKGASVFVVTEMTKGARRFETINGVGIYRVNGLYWLRGMPLLARRILNLKTGGDAGSGIFLRDKKIFKIFKYISTFLAQEIPNRWFLVSSLRLLRAKRRDFDVLHVHEAHWIASFGVRIARSLGKKVIIKEAMAGDLMTFKEQSSGSRKTAMTADCFIAISSKIRDDLVSIGVPEEKIIGIPNGVNLHEDSWSSGPSLGKAAICLTKLNQLPNKGIDVMIDAWRILVKKNNRKIMLRIFGAGNPRLQRQLTARMGVEEFVSFQGFTDNVRQCLLDSCMFVLPSRAEGLSNALLEAMSLGLPCVATNISGNQDLIQNGINGLLVPSENPAALAEAVSFILDNPDRASEMGCNARKTIERQYAISAISDKYAELYKRLVN